MQISSTWRVLLMITGVGLMTWSSRCASAQVVSPLVSSLSQIEGPLNYQELEEYLSFASADPPLALVKKAEEKVVEKQVAVGATPILRYLAVPFGTRLEGSVNDLRTGLGVDLESKSQGLSCQYRTGFILGFGLGPVEFGDLSLDISTSVGGVLRLAIHNRVSGEFDLLGEVLELQGGQSVYIFRDLPLWEVVYNFWEEGVVELLVLMERSGCSLLEQDRVTVHHASLGPPGA